MVSPRASSRNFEEATQQFINAGIPTNALLPIAPRNAVVSLNWEVKDTDLGKAPGRWSKQHKDWRGLGGGMISAGVTDADHKSFLSWPTPNVGVLGRYIPGIDSDACNEKARILVEDALTMAFGRDAAIAERLRGKGPRRLYAFEALYPDDPERRVRTRHLAYRLKGETEADPKHKLDIIGHGNQFLITGEHPSGDLYEWHPDFGLAELYQDESLERIENADIERFLATFREMLDSRGGEVLRVSGGSAPGIERDYSKEAPIMDPRDIMRGLKQYMKNDEDTNPDREDAVSILSSIRAALGEEADFYADDVCDWFTRDGWADAEYFDKIWRSLDSGVRVARDGLDRIFRKHGYYITAKTEFPSDHTAEMKGHREKKKKQKHEAQDIFDEVRSKFIFGEVNSLTGDDVFQMRRVFRPGVAFPVAAWWKFESLEHDLELLTRIKSLERYEDKNGMYVFLRDVNSHHGNAFYTGETRNPNYERGDIVPEVQQDGTITHSVNMRFMSNVLREAKRPTKNKARDIEDVDRILEFMEMVFGKDLVGYELDTLAYMLQTGKRPGHLLFLVGDQGVGKSIYMNMLVSMFDGIGKDQGGHIDGSKLLSDGARRFALAKVDGCRIISIKELPDGSTVQQMQAITASLKQIVDAGPDADWFQIESKRENSRSVQNFARVVISSNYRTAISLEEQDRRTFYVLCGITLENKPEAEFYEELTDVTTDPVRLAALVRHLRERDVSGYSANKAPPVTRAKMAATLAAIESPAERHLVAAVDVLRLNGRWLFDANELCSVMSFMSENEYKNTGQDDRKEYDMSAGGGILQLSKRLRKYVEIVGKYKGGNGRTRKPTIYGLRSKKDKWEKMLGDRYDIEDALERQQEPPHSLKTSSTYEDFRGPCSIRRD